MRADFVDFSYRNLPACICGNEVVVSDSAPAQRYNIRVPDPTHEEDQKHRRHAVYASETTGLLLIALMLLVLTLIRYWHDSHWSLR